CLNRLAQYVKNRHRPASFEEGLRHRDLPDSRSIPHTDHGGSDAIADPERPASPFLREDVDPPSLDDAPHAGRALPDETVSDEGMDVLGEMPPIDSGRLHDALLRQLAGDLRRVRIAGEVEEMEENPFFRCEPDGT